MNVKIVRIEQEKPSTDKIEIAINEEIRKLEKKNHTVKDVKLSVVRDAAPEYKTTKPYALTAMILFD